jgi:capsular polysaccharide biosynthesis protein
VNHLSSVNRFTTPDTFVGIIPRGRVVHNYGIVLSPGHKLLAEVSPPMAGHPATHPVLFELFMPPVRKLRSHIAVVTSQAHQRYFHWLFDILPRFELIQRSKVHVDQYVVNAELPFQKESLEILGIPTAQVISPQWATHIEAQALIVPSLPGQLGVVTPRSCEFLRTTFLPLRHQKAIAERFIYITRRNALTRRVLNEHELLDRMSRYDVEAIELEGMSVVRQAELFANALLILAPHGAGIANAVFCPKNSALIEFMPDTYNNPCFEILAGLRSLRYVRIPSHSASLVTHDQYVNVAEVEAKVREMLTSRD